MGIVPTKGKLQRLIRKATLGAKELVGETTGVWTNPNVRTPRANGRIKLETYNVHGG